MLYNFIISLVTFLVIYFILLQSTRFLLKNISEKKYNMIRKNLKIPLLMLFLNIALLILFNLSKQIFLKSLLSLSSAG